QASGNAPWVSTRSPHWTWGQPGRYYGRAGYRQDFGAGAAPAKVLATSPTSLLCPLRRFADGSRPPTSEGSRPACAWGDSESLSALLPGGIRFLPPPLPAAPSVGLATSLPRGGGLRAYHVPPTQPSGLGRVSRPVARNLRQGNAEAPAPGHPP